MKRAIEDIASFQCTGADSEKLNYIVTTGDRFTATGVERTHDSEAYVRNGEPGVIRWVSNNHCVPLDICERMGWGDMAAQRAADEADTTAFLEQYRKSQEEFEARTDPEAMAIKAERAFEMRAAFGPGEEVVNIVTGQRYKT